MAISDSSSESPRFIEVQPDWSADIEVETAFATDVIEARDGSEQRATLRLQPRRRLFYVASGYTAAEAALRRARGMSEVAAPLVTPLWPCYLTLDEMASVNRAAFDVSEHPDKHNFRKFKAGGWAYFVEAGKASVFREIEAIGVDYIDFVDGNGRAGWAGASTAAPSYAAGAKVYPCITAMREENQFAVGQEMLTSGGEEFPLDEL